MSGPSVKVMVAPSMLSSDFANLATEAKRMVDCGADWLHMDIMDNHFVPNLTIGAPVIASLRKHTNAFLDCHCMVSHPLSLVDSLKKAGASQITFHAESSDNPADVIHAVKAAGMRVGLALKPKTEVTTYAHLYKDVDMVLVMTVEPGFGGQKFMEHCLPKVTAIRKDHPNLDIQVDGGLTSETVIPAAKAGANVIVAGSFVFGAKDAKATIADLRKKALDGLGSGSSSSSRPGSSSKK